MVKKRTLSIRPVAIETGVNIHAEGSALINMGNTRVLCLASVERRVPDWLKGKGRGWVTAEYGMLPRATHTRMRRERDKTPSRSLEISRLVGRSLRAAVDLDRLGEQMITVDCDVLQADGGTRTAAITGGMVALALAIRSLRATGAVAGNPLLSPVAAVSVGIVDGELRLDLDYDADHRAEVDMNVVMNAAGECVEVQGSAEGKPFSRAALARMLDCAAGGIKSLLAAQKKALAAKR
jgi:ribonuclease PH